jgi:WD40 repeat protein
LRNSRIIHEITRKSYDGYDHRSLTLTPDGAYAISGGKNGYLCAYDVRTGKRHHTYVGHTDTVWGVAASADGRFLASASGDQTVKLWDLKTGRPLLTIFQSRHNDWVAWTPEGFFDASPGGTRYIGYIVNHGEDKASDFISFDQIFDRYYRPDLVAAKLEGRAPADEWKNRVPGERHDHRNGGCIPWDSADAR